MAWRGRRTVTAHGARGGRIELGRGWSGVLGGGGVSMLCRRDEWEGAIFQAWVGHEALELGLERAEAAHQQLIRHGGARASRRGWWSSSSADTCEAGRSFIVSSPAGSSSPPQSSPRRSRSRDEGRLGGGGTCSRAGARGGRRRRRRPSWPRRGVASGGRGRLGPTDRGWRRGSLCRGVERGL
jgi:hypothetical protein